MGIGPSRGVRATTATDDATGRANGANKNDTPS